MQKKYLKNHFGLFVMKYGQILRATVSKVFLMIISHIIFIHYDCYIGGHFVVSAILVDPDVAKNVQKNTFRLFTI